MTASQTDVVNTSRMKREAPPRDRTLFYAEHMGSKEREASSRSKTKEVRLVSPRLDDPGRHERRQLYDKHVERLEQLKSSISCLPYSDSFNRTIELKAREEQAVFELELGELRQPGPVPQRPDPLGLP